MNSKSSLKDKTQMSFADVVRCLEEQDGYAVPFILPKEDLKKIRELLSEHLRERLKKTHSEKENIFCDIEIHKYHQISDSLNHQELMKMTNRELSNEAVKTIQKMSFFKAIMEWFQNATIEDPLGYRVNFRITRPGKEADTFPAHADAWYFSNYEKLAGSTLAYEEDGGARLVWIKDENNPLNFKVVHVWIPIYCEPGLNGIKVAPGSQLRQWKKKKVASSRYVTTFPKYELDESEKLELKLLKTEPGEVLLFHDKLLHQGAINRGNESRIALLFNIHIMK